MSQLGLSMTEKEPPRQRGRAALVVAVAAVVLVAGAVAVWFGLGSVLSGVVATAPEDYPGPGQGEVQVEIEVGDSATTIGQTLAEADVVASAEAFTAATRAEPAAAGIQPGLYDLQLQMSAEDALDVLIDPDARVRAQVTVPEGLQVGRTLEVLAEETDIALADFEAALEDPEAIGLPDYAGGQAQGFLFPATYQVRPDATATDVLSRMVDRFEEAASTVGLEEGSELSAYELVTVASLLEAEARLPEDYGRVSRVIHNRLAEDMRLQLDSTVNYALGETQEFVSLEDIEVESPYNTYQVEGLPPTPINSPGERALAAAKNPVEGDWLYFVTVDLETGETKFTDDYDEFLQFKSELAANRDG
jgi:UPF0755 protein